VPHALAKGLAALKRGGRPADEVGRPCCVGPDGLVCSRKKKGRDRSSFYPACGSWGEKSVSSEAHGRAQ